MIYQNGIWMEDIVGGVAIALPWRHSQALNWNNYDITFFALFDQITTPAFVNNNGVGSAFGTAWFIEAYEGYIEADYAYLLNRVEDDFSYHNVAIAYTRRYFQFLSNSVRVINNVGQNFDAADRTADGTLLLVENAFRTSKATTVIPYANFFYGLRRTQSVARAGVAGGILRNTGIMFESDNLTNYPTLDATGNGTYGGAFGLNLFASDFRQQFVLNSPPSTVTVTMSLTTSTAQSMVSAVDIRKLSTTGHCCDWMPWLECEMMPLISMVHAQNGGESFKVKHTISELGHAEF